MNTHAPRAARAQPRASRSRACLLTMVDERTNLTQQVMARDPRSTSRTRSSGPSSRGASGSGRRPSFGKPILLYDIRSRGAEAYLDLAKEVMAHEKKGAGQGALRPPAGS